MSNGRKYFYDIVNVLDAFNLGVFVTFSYSTFSMKDWNFITDILGITDKINLYTNKQFVIPSMLVAHFNEDPGNYDKY